jgi:hypothetical protein
MKDITLRQIHFAGITMQVPEIWEVETEEYDEADGTKSYSLSISANGKDARSIDISWGIIPEGSDAYNEACATYEEVVTESDLSSDDEPIICFEFQKREAFGFNVWTDDGIPCFFFCVGVPSKGSNHLLTVLVSAMNNDELRNLIEFTEEYLATN